VGCNGLNVCIRCEAKGHEYVRSSSERPCHNDSHYFHIRMNPDADSERLLSQAAAADAPSAAASAHHVSVDPGVQTAHVFREDGSKTQLRSRATTSRDEDAMAVPKVEDPAPFVCHGCI
jgi:murein endopeptidase